MRVGIIMLGVQCALSVCAESIRLSEDGTARASIVIAEKATRSAKFGAQDLRWHLKKMTGSDFPIVRDIEAGDGFKICVGESACTQAKAADLRGQQCIVDVRTDRIELVGCDAKDYRDVSFTEEDGIERSQDLPGLYDEHGSMYAVYEFLEKNCGVNWVDASDYGSLIPTRRTLDIAVGTAKYEPFMAYRGGTVEYLMDPTYWRHNTPEWQQYRKAAFGGRSEAEVDRRFRLFQLRQRVGGLYARANHSFYWMYDYYLRKESKRFKEHRPEYFAKGHPGEPPQLCYTSPETIACIVRHVRGYFDATKEDGSYGGVYISAGGSRVKCWGEDRCCLEPMDNVCFCECPSCKALFEMDRAGENSQHSTYWFTFVNRVAREVKKTHPGKYITTLAYMSHEGLPTGVRLEDNVEVFFCISDNRENPRGELCKAQLERMRQWHEAYPSMRLGVWLYGGFPLEFAHNGNYKCLPGYFAHEAARQYRFLKSVNACVGNCNCGLSGTVCQYMAYALMRDPEQEADVLLDRFFSQYGAAAKPLRRFYDIVESRYCDLSYRPKNVSSRSSAASWQCRCPPEVVNELGECMESAHALAKTPEEIARVRIFELGEWQWIKSGSAEYVARQLAPMPSWTASRIADAEGDIDKVAWDRLDTIRAPIYEKGSETVAKPDVLGLEVKLGHDGKFLYLELVQIRDLDKIKVSGHINPCDDWELIVSRQRAQPYRCYFVDPESRISAASWGEVNWRQDVSSVESCGDRAYFATTRSRLDSPNRWVQRFAFPLDRFLDRPISGGDTFYLNPVTVINGTASKCRGLGIFSPVSYSTVHTCDRSVAVTLER